jgi:hypothetical protein
MRIAAFELSFGDERLKSVVGDPFSNAQLPRTAVMAPRCRNTVANGGRWDGASPIPDPEKSQAAAAAKVAIQRMAEGASVKFKTTSTPRQPVAAPSRSTPYTVRWQTGCGSGQG